MSMIAQPESKISNLTAEVNRFMETSDFSELDLKRLKKEAEYVKDNVDVADGFDLLGMVACLEDDMRAMKSYFKRAIDQSGGYFLHVLNYSISLRYFGLYEEAYEQALKVYGNNRSYLHALDNLIGVTCVLNKREEFRMKTLTQNIVAGSIIGLGPEGYLLALEYFSYVK